MKYSAFNTLWINCSVLLTNFVILATRVVRQSSLTTQLHSIPHVLPAIWDFSSTPSPDGYLDVMVPARSNDMVVGFPLDIARYAIILTVIAKAVGMKPRYVYMPSANSHIYENCYRLAEEID